MKLTKAKSEEMNKSRLQTNFSTKQKNKIHSYRLAEKLDKYLEVIRQQCFKKIGELQARGYYSNEPLTFENKTLGDPVNLYIGYKWAKNLYDSLWINFSGGINDSVNEKDVAFIINVGGDGLVVNNNGEQIQSISEYQSDYMYLTGSTEKNVVLNNGFIKNGQISFWVDCCANCYTGINKSRVTRMDIVIINRDIIELYYDLQAIISVYNFADSNYANKIESVIEQLNIFDINALDNTIAKQISLILSQILTNKNVTDQFTFSAVGHSHIDLAMTKTNESARKVARVFTDQLMNLDLFDNYIFGASSPQYYKWIKDKYPLIYDRIKQKVAQGKWELQGATWVEMDSNVVGSESLIRQFYYGKRFFIEEFNKQSNILWLPDSFGYSPVLPQIMKLSNTPYLLSRVLQNNNSIKIPYNTFNWAGIDGSQVLVHILPEGSYNKPIKADRMLLAQENTTDKTSSLMLYDAGSGGLGTSYQHIARVNRLKDIKPLPKVKIEKAVDFFDRINNTKQDLPVYSKDLYVDRYQGSYSSAFFSKYFNRKIEILLRNYELLVAQLGLTDEQLPISKQELDNIWKEVLLYQHYQIMSGASTNEVYEQCYISYDIIFNKLKYTINELLKQAKGGECFYNPNSFNYEHIYKFNDKWYRLDIPQFAFVKKEQGEEITAYYGIAGDTYIENKMYKIAFNDGVIVSLYDKYYNKEFVKEGMSMANYSVYTDNGDSLNFDKSYISTKHNLRCTAFETYKNGPIVGAKIIFGKGKIKVEENISITDGKEGIDILAKIGFYDKNKMIRVNFDTNIDANECTYNTQFGHIKRTTLDNTNEEKAIFEAVGHKFVDISNSNYGLSIINDCKYGFRNKNNKISMCLVRSAKGGLSNRLDNGNFEVKMQILPHYSYMNTNTYKQAYIVNNPIMEFTGNKKLTPKKLSIDNENIILESVKLANNGGVIVRLYNCTEKTQSANISFGRRQQRKIVDIMENCIADVTGALEFKPFELINLLFD